MPKTTSNLAAASSGQDEIKDQKKATKTELYKLASRYYKRLFDLIPKYQVRLAELFNTDVYPSDENIVLKFKELKNELAHSSDIHEKVLKNYCEIILNRFDKDPAFFEEDESSAIEMKTLFEKKETKEEIDIENQNNENKPTNHDNSLCDFKFSPRHIKSWSGPCEAYEFLLISNSFLCGFNPSKPTEKKDNVILKVEHLVDTGAPIYNLKMHSNFFPKINAIRRSNDEIVVVSQMIGFIYSIEVWKQQNWNRSLSFLVCKKDNFIDAVLFHKPKIVALCFSREIYFFSFQTGEYLRRFYVRKTLTQMIGFGATQETNQLHIFFQGKSPPKAVNIRTLEIEKYQILKLSPTTFLPNRLCFLDLPRTKRVIIASAHRLWLGTYEDKWKVFPYQVCEATSLLATTDEKKLVVGTKDGQIIIYDIEKWIGNNLKFFRNIDDYLINRIDLKIPEKDDRKVRYIGLNSDGQMLAVTPKKMSFFSFPKVMPPKALPEDPVTLQMQQSIIRGLSPTGT